MWKTKYFIASGYKLVFQSSLALRERLYGFRKSNHRFLRLNWISITITYTLQIAAPLKMHFYNTFDGNSASNFKRRCDFFQLSEVAFWSGVLFEYIQAPGITISLLSNWQTQTSTIRNGFVIELKQKVELVNQFTFLKSTVSLVPAVLLQGLFCNTFKAPKAFKPTSMINVCSTLVLFVYGSDKINFCFLLILYFHSGKRSWQTGFWCLTVNLQIGNLNTCHMQVEKNCMCVCIHVLVYIRIYISHGGFFISSHHYMSSKILEGFILHQ